MTVKELKQMLEKYPDDKEILCYKSGEFLCPILYNVDFYSSKRSYLLIMPKEVGLGFELRPVVE